MEEQILWSTSKCQSTEEGKTLVPKTSQTEPEQLLGCDVLQNRNVLGGLQDLFKPRDSKLPRQQWANQFIVEINIQLKKSSCFWQPHAILGRQLFRLELQRH